MFSDSGPFHCDYPENGLMAILITIYAEYVFMFGIGYDIFRLLVCHPPENFDPEIEDRSGFPSWSVLVLTARDADSLCTLLVLHTVRRSCRDRFSVAP